MTNQKRKTQINYLNNLTKPSQDKPIMMTIFGQAGLGKTTLAESFEKPILIPVEDGTASLIGQDVSVMPRPRNHADLLNQIIELGQAEHEFKTLIVDSISALDLMLIKEVIDSDRQTKKRTLNAVLGVFGAGYSMLSQLHQQFKMYCDRLVQSKGMNVIFVSHATDKTITPPDNDPYSVITLDMTKQAIDHYVNQVDIVAFIKIELMVTDNKAYSTGKRVICCHASASNVSKNRFGIDKEMPFIKGENPFKDYLKYWSKKA
jgi:hypothetical protein